MDINRVRILEGIESFWQEGKFCDFTIKVEDKTFKAHRLWLASCSDYFRCMFDNPTIEAAKNEVELRDVTPIAIETILTYWYTSKISLTNDNVGEILMAAHLLQSDEIVRHCFEFIESIINVNNCLDIFATAELLNIRELYEMSLDYCLDTFDKIIQQENFLESNDRIISILVGHDSLHVQNESTVLKAILNWVSHDTVNRLQHLNKLISLVRFSLLDTKQINEIVDDHNGDFKLFNQSLECNRIVNKALLKKLTLSDATKTNLNEISKLSDKIRRPLRKQQKIFAVGGWSLDSIPTESMEYYDCVEQQWIECEPMKRVRYSAGICIFKKSIYMIGGHNLESYLRDIEKFDLKTCKWHDDVAEMSINRSSLGTVILNNQIYAIGGQCVARRYDPNSINLVEIYDPDLNIWKVGQPLLECRLGLGAVVLNGRIYAIGGYNKDITSTVECFDPDENIWFYVAPMLTKRKHFGCTVQDRKIYVAGGRSQDNVEVDKAECYDPETDKWTEIAPMNQARSAFGLVALDGSLYAIGGLSADNKKLNNMEIYDPTNDTWKETTTPMNKGRVGASFVVYSRLK